MDEEKYVNDELFSDIRKNFVNKVAPSKHGEEDHLRLLIVLLARQPIHELVDKSKELRVLDPKAAQNFGKDSIR